MKHSEIYICTLLIGLIFSCSQKENVKTLVVENTLNQTRTFETVELTPSLLKEESLNNIKIKDVETGKFLVTQLVDTDTDGTMDLLLFQPEIGGNTKKTFEIVGNSVADNSKPEIYCYSRFVPERTDDYAWENNRVAFRIFGPTAQKMAEEGIKGGTLSSGVDAWLKRVDYPIIDKWYKKELETEGTYHVDTGEGLDNFHVGTSRGLGGVAVKRDSIFYLSKNFVNYRTITKGPIRTSFYVEYEDWQAGEDVISEAKSISLDYGSNLSRFEIITKGTNELSSGLTLHEKDGEVSTNKEKGWVSYWQPHGDSELGTAIVAAPGYFVDSEKYDVEEKDLSNLYAHLKVKGDTVVYYAGFAWKESNQFKNRQEWENYLNEFSQRISNPLKVSLVE